MNNEKLFQTEEDKIVEEIRLGLINKLKNNNWGASLKGFIYSSEFTNIIEKLIKERIVNDKRFTPTFKDVFKVFETTDINDIKVVILGQDPYPGLDIADGLAFSCSKSKKAQPSLDYIQRAIEKTVYLNSKKVNQLDLTYLSKQGVFLLNSALTVELNKPGTHSNIWKPFIQYVLDILNYKTNNVVFIFMGSKAQAFSNLITNPNHIKLYTSHPASAMYSGEKEWYCDDVFNKTNNHLLSFNKQPIIW